MGETVKIYKMDRGFSAFFWLCPKHVREKKKNGWEVVETKAPPHPLECEECRFAKGAPPF